MNTWTKLKEALDSARHSLAYKVEGVVIELTEQITARMGAKRLSRSEFAKQLSCSPAHVTKILRGGTNFTIESMVKIADALDSDLKVDLVPRSTAKDWIQIIRPSAHQAEAHNKWSKIAGPESLRIQKTQENFLESIPYRLVKDNDKELSITA